LKSSEVRVVATQFWRFRPPVKIWTKPGSTEAWSDRDLKLLQHLVSLEVPMRHIARRLGRPEESVRRTSHIVAMANMGLAAMPGA
jgi:hypothetical protein